jgi:hypothetical protein
MQATVAHYYDKMVFFFWVPFIQMHMVINIPLNFINWDLDLN